MRYVSPYDSVNHLFTATTVPHPANTAFAGTCYMGSASLHAAGCDHFGVHLLYTAAANKATTTAYRWMFADPNNPGQLIASTNNIFVPTPVYTWVPRSSHSPPVLDGGDPTADPPPPPPPALPPQFGNATWMKVYKTDMNREVALDRTDQRQPDRPPERRAARNRMGSPAGRAASRAWRQSPPPQPPAPTRAE